MKNFIIDNIFTNEEIDQLYEHINNTPEDKKYNHPSFGHTAYFSWVPEAISKKIEKIANDNSDKPLVLRELSFARYDTNGGTRTPLLFPHYDDPFKEQRITVDIQVKSTLPWAIVVEDESFTLKDNQALVFSGTHQIHWREKASFSDTDYMDMIFCHFSEPLDVAEKISDEHYNNMTNMQKIYRAAWDKQ